VTHRHRKPWPKPDRLEPPASREAWLESYRQFIRAIREVGSTDNGVFGIKLHWRQLELVRPILQALEHGHARPDSELLERWFPNPRYVFLRRQSKVRQAVSYYRALTTRVWWETDGARRSDPIALEANIEEIERLRLKLAQHEQNWRGFFSSAGVRPLELVYEEIVRNPEQAVAAVLRHLEVDTEIQSLAPTPMLRRQARRPTDEFVRSYAVAKRSGLLTQERLDGRPTTARNGRTRPDVLVASNFYSDPVAVREYALRQEYFLPYQSQSAVDSGRQQPTWLTSRFKASGGCPFKSCEKLIRRLEELTGEPIDRDYWFADFPADVEGKPVPHYRLLVDRGCYWNCSFHCKLESRRVAGAGVHNHVIDTWNPVGFDGWAGVVYLNLGHDCRSSSGLKLWTNRDQGGQLDWMTPSEEWQLTDDIGNVPNRLILYRGNLPHSGADGWGQTLHDGQLFQTFFFKTLAQRVYESVGIEV
jgi:LPS sulfotransferase NodH